jgi:hypothetical protein
MRILTGQSNFQELGLLTGQETSQDAGIDTEQGTSQYREILTVDKGCFRTGDIQRRGQGPLMT